MMDFVELRPHRQHHNDASLHFGIIRDFAPVETDQGHAKNQQSDL